MEKITIKYYQWSGGFGMLHVLFVAHRMLPNTKTIFCLWCLPELYVESLRKRQNIKPEQMETFL